MIKVFFLSSEYIKLINKKINALLDSNRINDRIKYSLGFTNTINDRINDQTKFLFLIFIILWSDINHFIKELLNHTTLGQIHDSSHHNFMILSGIANTATYSDQ